MAKGRFVLAKPSDYKPQEEWVTFRPGKSEYCPPDTAEYGNSCYSLNTFLNAGGTVETPNYIYFDGIKITPDEYFH